MARGKEIVFDAQVQPPPALTRTLSTSSGQAFSRVQEREKDSRAAFFGLGVFFFVEDFEVGFGAGVAVF